MPMRLHDRRVLMFGRKPDWYRNRGWTPMVLHPADGRSMPRISVQTVRAEVGAVQHDVLTGPEMDWLEEFEGDFRVEVHCELVGGICTISDRSSSATWYPKPNVPQVVWFRDDRDAVAFKLTFENVGAVA